MPKFSFSSSKSKSSVHADEESHVKTRSPMKKVVKKVKQQFMRLDEMLHHVTHTKHPERLRTVSFSSSVSSSSPPPIVHAFVPPSSPSIFHSKFHTEPDIRSIDRTSGSCSVHSELQPAVPPSSAEFGLLSPIMDEEQLSEPSTVEEEPSNSEPMFTSPPTVYVEPEAPDPFLIDEEGDALSDDEQDKQGSSAPISQDVSPAHNVPLDLPTPSPQPVTQLLPPVSPVPNLNKDVPPPPSSDSDLDEEEVPDIYVPHLIVPAMFLPIPNTDPLTTLLNKYIHPPERRPTRDLAGEWQRSDFHTLVMGNSWRALARMARDRLVTSDPSDLSLILGLWHLRLSCLARLRLFNQTSAECTNLFTVLNAIDPPEAREYVFERILPFELEVMQTRLKYWAGDHMGYLDALSALLKKCRTKCRQSGNDQTLVPMWKERGARVCLIIASQMVEMKEISAAVKLLEPLCKQGDVSSPSLRSAVARIYLQGGYLDMASKHFALVEADPAADEFQKIMNAAVLASAQGEWSEAADKFKEISEKDANNFVAVNDLSVALLSQGKVKEGIQVLEVALRASPSSVVVAEPFLFNLSTLYELQSSRGFEKKKELLVEVAKWSGDGLRTNCLKMPSN
ncbi:hypothetical protein CPB84DRAFT_1813897 [Gymnopilus junonius]|uniref:Uncharacterized protein n=1 Tax=Gymnopilus junonius TaxID=109634 RepID=A0A9P5NV71_GYMJU|nr:hypothetical protein CPB84DRAFT_1813897 [Gymnopilus junonius]